MSVSLADYKARMKEGQEAIYYISADTLSAAKPRLPPSTARDVPGLQMSVSHKHINYALNICHRGCSPLKSRPAVFTKALHLHANTAPASTLLSTYQENNMQKNTTSLWAGSAVAGLNQ